jgi:hypothetical protein
MNHDQQSHSPCPVTSQTSGGPDHGTKNRLSGTHLDLAQSQKWLFNCCFASLLQLRNASKRSNKFSARETCWREIFFAQQHVPQSTSVCLTEGSLKPQWEGKLHNLHPRCRRTWTQLPRAAPSTQSVWLEAGWRLWEVLKAFIRYHQFNTCDLHRLPKFWPRHLWHLFMDHEVSPPRSKSGSLSRKGAWCGTRATHCRWTMMMV